MTTKLRAVREFQKAIGTIDSYFGRFRRNDLNAKASCLDHCASRKISPGESGWKAEIIFDATRHARLPAGCFALDHNCSQALARAINGRGQTCRTTADDCEIVEGFGGPSLKTGVLGKLGQ